MPLASESHNGIDMYGSPIKLPSTAALTAFEAAARLGNFTRAAAELHTSQPAISRHVADLEVRLGILLFHRRAGGLVLTKDGETLRRAIASGFGEIGGAIANIQRRLARPSVTIACSYDIAHLVLMPRYGELSAAIGAAGLRVLATEFEHIVDLRGQDIDLAIAGGAPPDLRTSFEPLFQERVVPLAAPEFWRRHGTPTDPATLLDLPLLELDKPNFGWMDWAKWFDRIAPKDGPPRPTRRYPNYVYILEAAAAGEGVALGWDGYCDGYLATGRLSPSRIPAITTEGGCYAAPNRESPAADLVANLILELRTITVSSMG